MNRSASPNVLTSIREPECNLAIWERDDAPDVSAFTELLRPHRQFTVPLESLQEELETQFAGLPDSSAALADDILMLAEHFCRVLQLETLEVRLEVVTTDACRKFHADWVKARLITTYLGSGTQWLATPEVERLERGLEPSRIEQLTTGHVGFFKGKLATKTPAIHRSPPIAGTGEKRVLLVFNPPAQDDE